MRYKESDTTEATFHFLFTFPQNRVWREGWPIVLCLEGVRVGAASGWPVVLSTPGDTGEAQGSGRGLPPAGQLRRWTLASAPVGPCAEGQWLTPVRL